MLGGGALLASTVLALSLQPLAEVIPGIGFVWAVIYSGGLLILALGIRGAGSVTDSRPLGTVALVGLAGWLLARSIIGSLGSVPGENLTASFFPEAMIFGTVDALLCVILAAGACVGVLRSKAIPDPWNRVPSWCLAAITLCWLVQTIYGVTAPADFTPVGAVLSSLVGAATSVASVVLGVSAVLLADRMAGSITQKRVA